MQLKQTPITDINIPELSDLGITLSVKRDDMQHDVVSGNKLYKLFYHLDYCIKNKIKTIVTYGGAYSNHLHATAFAAKSMNMKSVGIIRGEQILPLNPTLKDCTEWGMTLEPVSRSDYQIKDESIAIQNVLTRYAGAHIIPEGGSDVLGVKGAGLILEGVNQADFDYIVCACGTGTTLAGIISKADKKVKVLGIAVLKGASWMQGDVQNWLNKLELKTDHQLPRWSVNTDYHFGGYGKIKPEITQFIERFKHDYNLPLEPIYTGKSLSGVLDLAKKGYFKKGSRILFIHTGGLQGAR